MYESCKKQQKKQEVMITLRWPETISNLRMPERVGPNLRGWEAWWCKGGGWVCWGVGGVVVQGGRVGMLRGGRDSLNWNTNFKVSKLLGFLVAWFIGFFVSSFQRFKKHLMLLEDIDPIFAIFKNFSDGSQGFPAHVSSNIFVFRYYRVHECFFRKVGSIFCGSMLDISSFHFSKA